MPRTDLDAALDALEIPTDPAARGRHVARTAEAILGHGIASAAHRGKLTPEQLTDIEGKLGPIVETLATTCTAGSGNREALHAAILQAARATGSLEVEEIVATTLKTPDLADMLFEHMPEEGAGAAATVAKVRTTKTRAREDAEAVRIAAEVPGKVQRVTALRRQIAKVEKNLAEKAQQAGTAAERAEAADQLTELQQMLEGMLTLFPTTDVD